MMFLAVTGFEIHGSYLLFGFEKAVSFHRTTAYLLLGLIAFSVFWHFTTDGWRHYIPTTRNILAQKRLYAISRRHCNLSGNVGTIVKVRIGCIDAILLVLPGQSFYMIPRYPLVTDVGNASSLYHQYHYLSTEFCRDEIVLD